MDSIRQDYQMDLNSKKFIQKVSIRQEAVFAPLYHILHSFSDHQHSVAASETKFLT